jgi:hypothetical protein
MLTAAVIIGFAIIIFQVGAQRILLVTLVKQVGMLNLLVEQLNVVDSAGVAERMQAEIDIAAGKHG